MKVGAHICIEQRVGADIAENERKFGYGYCVHAMNLCIEYIPGFREWFTEKSGVDPETPHPQGIPWAAYLLYQRVYNAVYNPKGRKEDGTRAARSREHYQHESKWFLRQWRSFAEQVVQAGERIRVRSKLPRNETLKKVIDPIPVQVVHTEQSSGQYSLF